MRTVAGWYTAFMVFLPVLFIPFLSVPVESQKGILACTAFVFLVLAYTYYLRQRRFIVIPFDSIAYLGVPLIIAALCSSFLVPLAAWRSTLFGISTDTGTVMSLILFASVLISGVFIRRTHLRILLRAFPVLVALAGGYAIIVLLRNSAAIETPAGSWSQLSYLIGAALVVSVIQAVISKGVWRYIELGCIAVLSFELISFYDGTVLLLLLGVMLSTAVLDALLRRQISFSVLQVTLFFATMAVAALILSDVRGIALPLTPEIRPSLALTYDVVSSSYLDWPRGLIGTGPETFEVIWQKNRPMSVILSPYWSTPFFDGYSTALTLAGTLGLIGLLAFLIVPVTILRELIGNKPLHDDETRSLALVSMALLLFAFGAAVIFAVSLPLFLLIGSAAGLSGSFIRGADRVRIYRTVRIKAMIVTIFIVAMLLLISVLPQGVALQLFSNGQLVEDSHIEESDDLYSRATQFWPSSRYDLAASAAQSAEAFALYSQGNITASDPNAKKFTALIYKAIEYSTRASVIDRLNEGVWLRRALLFIHLIQFQYPTASDLALQSVHSARVLSPNDPQTYYLEALLDHAAGNQTAALAALDQALVLKANYDDALKLRAQILQQ